ncbi:acyl-CoA-binding protein [Hymenobacter monticola]|uniref:Acyl-CoA-binding protein n=1 Tax=Hymenobacter monticola TaxID=1705399 RepID=A0ABY4AY63_9BACT|nr:acyl-CoA-binding protein [Hymenobacter monticola]UOE31833.1 acyl-CoA-binding protein [Hymenobacter monticola]
MDLNAQFQAAADKVNNLPGDQAAKHMTEFYGLYKQATEGDVNMQPGEVDPNAADKASGPAGLSQAQWDSWNQFKGVSEDEAKRRYVAKANEITGQDNTATEASQVPTDGQTGAPTGSTDSDTENTTTARQPDHGPGQQTAGGLRGDITAGAPYGGEDKLKGAQE